MSLPSYCDLGKSLKDLLTKGYHFGQLKVSTKSQAKNDLEISSNTAYKLEDSTIAADIQAKMTKPAYGLTCSTKWDTAGVITKEISCQDYLATGMKIGTNLKCDMTSGNRTAEILTQYKLKYATLDTSFVASDENNLLLNASVVAGYNNFIAGAQLGYDNTEGALKKNNLVVGYLGSNYYGLVNLDNLENVSGRYYQDMCPNIQFGIEASVQGQPQEEGAAAPAAEGAEAAPAPEGGSSGGPTFAIGGKYVVNDAVTIRGKISDQSALGVGCEVKVAEGASIFVSANIDGKNFAEGKHQIGLALELS